MVSVMSMPSLSLSACRYKNALEALYAQHEERQRERVRAIRAQGGQSSTAERVKHVRHQTVPFTLAASCLAFQLTSASLLRAFATCVSCSPAIMICCQPLAGMLL